MNPDGSAGITVRGQRQPVAPDGLDDDAGHDPHALYSPAKRSITRRSSPGGIAGQARLKMGLAINILLSSLTRDTRIKRAFSLLFQVLMG